MQYKNFHGESLYFSTPPTVLTFYQCNDCHPQILNPIMPLFTSESISVRGLGVHSPY
uniref:Uncharacterized protein n=1 Tax=Rhizophora mucronata TaxID=61149 RepID=A0A2P2NCP1_RHIMU